mmetsp:Transcript_58783/g.133063  ORF Transcript_58783/g.133063 Transcript_58783/m.133063 type:complete len:348 (+) Transcript_58783:143-1186(+)
MVHSRQSDGLSSSPDGPRPENLTMSSCLKSSTQNLLCIESTRVAKTRLSIFSGTMIPTCKFGDTSRFEAWGHHGSWNSPPPDGSSNRHCIMGIGLLHLAGHSKWASGENTAAVPRPPVGSKRQRGFPESATPCRATAAAEGLAAAADRGGAFAGFGGGPRRVEGTREPHPRRSQLGAAFGQPGGQRGGPVPQGVRRDHVAQLPPAGRRGGPLRPRPQGAGPGAAHPGRVRSLPPTVLGRAACLAPRVRGCVGGGHRGAAGRPAARGAHGPGQRRPRKPRARTHRRNLPGACDPVRLGPGLAGGGPRGQVQIAAGHRVRQPPRDEAARRGGGAGRGGGNLLFLRRRAP